MALTKITQIQYLLDDLKEIINDNFAVVQRKNQEKTDLETQIQDLEAYIEELHQELEEYENNSWTKKIIIIIFFIAIWIACFNLWTYF